MTTNLTLDPTILIPVGASADMAPEAVLGQRLGTITLKTLILLAACEPAVRSLDSLRHSSPETFYDYY